MRILWIKSDFLHPTNRGGQIRTLEMLRRLRRRHEIHYLAFADPDSPEGVERSVEYCHRPHPVPRRPADRGSLRFWGQFAENLLSPLPIAVGRYRSAQMERRIRDLTRCERFDHMVCDFIMPSVNVPDLSRCVLFQHNVETVVWQRLAKCATDPVRRLYYGVQARRMYEYESRVCRAVRFVVAVSAEDAAHMRSQFGVSHVSEVPTGVDLDFFSPPAAAPFVADLAFLGSMDWLPNIDAVCYFVEQILPLIRRRRPDCSLAVIGRKPPASIRALAERDPKIVVTGTVGDVRPYLWGSLVSIVPLRIGGGTRLKIYESMAARRPVVSTAVGAEGLEVSHPENIRLADAPADFADRCLELLEDASERRRVSSAAWELVASRYSWEQVSQRFEQVLEMADGPAGPPTALRPESAVTAGRRAGQ
jgi:glycosyltransferase involved in cell wall biosynthesis